MRDIVRAVLDELGLDYQVTMIASGERTRDVTFFDRGAGEHFRIPLPPFGDTTEAGLKETLKRRLQERLETRRGAHATASTTRRQAAVDSEA